MRNLRSQQQTWIKFSEENLPLTASTWDTDSNALLSAFGPSEHRPIIELRRFDESAVRPEDGSLIASWDAPCPLPDLACDEILSLKYLPETQTSCLILAGGDIVLVREHPQPAEDLIEIVGSIDTGISAASWSPDDELVAICTRADTLIIMTRSFDSTANVVLSPDDVKVSSHVSVGWGKKETQFQGKRAKALRDPTVPDRIDEGTLSPFDDGATTVSWRGDGAYLAVNRQVHIAGADRRMIRIFSREGVLDSVSEPVDGLESALSWRPSGNLIAAIQHLSDRLDVVFFERNGLRHGQFTLLMVPSTRPDWSKRICLHWNVDSSVLAISFEDRVQLWTMGNYHYYLKQEIMSSNRVGSVGTLWHPEKALSLALSGSNSLRRTLYSFNPIIGPVSPPNDFGLAAVVDGCKVELTPLRIANVPPPMSWTELHVDGHVSDVAINKTSTKVAVLHGSIVDVFQLDLTCFESSAPPLLYSLQLADPYESSSEPCQIAFTNDDVVSVLLRHPNTNSCGLASGDAASSIKYIEVRHQAQIVALQSSLKGNTPLIQILEPRSTTSLWLLDRQTGSMTRIGILPAICPQLYYNFLAPDKSEDFFGLSPGGVLYVTRGATAVASEIRLQLKGITSFLVTPSHLIFTTTSHLIKFVHIHDGLLEVPLDEPEKDERCRAIERGAKLVTAMPSKCSVVLQMPRGNLETIYPRAMVLAGIREALAAKKYRTAFLACRNQRVDMNILHDYAPEQFLSNVPLFIDQVKKLAHIDLFLSQIREEDVCKTLYRDTLPSAMADQPLSGVNDEANMSNGHLPTGTTHAPAESKVNRICSAFLVALSSRRETHLQNIVTAHVSRNPPDLEAGLVLVSELRQSSSVDTDKAVEHICFLADVNRLYDAALGLYDLDVALLVAQQSQKDPREYLPYMQGLQELSEYRRKFTIDNDLKRHGKALGWLHKLDSWDEFLRYVQKHSLYAAALELIRYDKARLAEVMRLYAEWLSGQHRYREAGIAYDFLQEHETASEAYRSANLWREALTSAQLAQKTPDEVHALATSLAEGLSESKDWADAALVYSDYLNDPEEAASCYCKAYLFSEAVSVVVRNRSPDLLKSTIDTGIAEAFATMSEMLAEMKSQIQAQTSRLRELRVKKAQDPLSFYDDAPTGNNPDIPDDVSIAPSEVTTSAGTFMTRYTNRTTSTLATNTTRRTSKNRRREERKKARGKKGSVYEEEYLVASIARLVERLNSVSEEVGRLVEACVRRGMRERAVAVQGQMVELGRLIKAALPEVFEGLVDGSGEKVVETEGGERVKMPTVKHFEGLSLLD